MSLSDKKLSEVITSHGDITVHEAWRKGMFDKPEPKKIDMSVCVESRILCLFTKVNPVYGERTQFLALYNMVLNHQVNKGDLLATPYMDGFIHASPTGWDKCPIPEGFMVNVWTDNHSDVEVNYGSGHNGWRDEIIMFEITGIAEGWEL